MIVHLVDARLSNSVLGILSVLIKMNIFYMQTFLVTWWTDGRLLRQDTGSKFDTITVSGTF